MRSKARAAGREVVEAEDSRTPTGGTMPWHKRLRRNHVFSPSSMQLVPSEALGSRLGASLLLLWRRSGILRKPAERKGLLGPAH